MFVFLDVLPENISLSQTSVVETLYWKAILLLRKFQYIKISTNTATVCTKSSKKKRVFLTVHLLYFTPPPPTPPKVLMSHSNLQQFYNGGGRGGKIGPKRPWKALLARLMWSTFGTPLFLFFPFCGEQIVPVLLCL